MIEEQAYVVALHGEFAEIATRQQAACGNCSAKSGCGTSLLSAWFPQRDLRFRLKNEIGARSGDTVVVGLDEGALQRNALLLYAVPLVGLLAGAVLGETVFGRLGLPAELGAVLSGLLGLTGALALVRYQTAVHRAGSQAGVSLLRVARRAITIAPDGMQMPAVQQPEEFRKHE